MNTQPENKDKAEQELSEKELEKATGGADGKVSVHDFPMTKIVDKSSPAL
jgi:type VI protein secretion system component Hcp